MSHRQTSTRAKVRDQASGGFTLVELLVVIAIIGVFLAMSLPALLATRETARRAHCSNNLTQIMLGLQHYESAHEVLPAGVTDDHGPIVSAPVGLHHNWISRILPYLDEGTTYANIDFERSVYGNENEPVRKLTLAVLNCPSKTSLTSGTSSYAACHHDLEAPIDADNHGVLFLNSAVRIADITDGAAHTIFVGERQDEDGDLGWMSGTRATLRNTGSALGMTSGKLPTDITVLPAEVSAPAPGQPDALEASVLASGPLEARTYVGGFGSPHPGVTLFGFGDGRVEPLSDDIPRRLLRQLAHRADGQLRAE